MTDIIPETLELYLAGDIDLDSLEYSYAVVGTLDTTRIASLTSTARWS